MKAIQVALSGILAQVVNLDVVGNKLLMEAVLKFKTYETQSIGSLAG
jgi:hypothetical protein